MRGELEFEGALRERVAMLAGLPEAELERAYAERVRLNPGARTFVRTLTASGAHCVLVSGGFDFFTRRVAVQAGFHARRPGGVYDWGHVQRHLSESDLLRRWGRFLHRRPPLRRPRSRRR